jgi:hypothetical protein
MKTQPSSSAPKRRPIQVLMRLAMLVGAVLLECGAQSALMLSLYTAMWVGHYGWAVLCMLGMALVCVPFIAFITWLMRPLDAQVPDVSISSQADSRKA